MTEFTECLGCGASVRLRGICACGLHEGLRRLRDGTDAQEPIRTHRTVAELPLDEGRKDDGGKARMDLIAPELPHYLGLVLAKGAVKYKARNWEKGMSWGRPIAAALRHLFAWIGGQRYDPETGLPHLAHLACNVMFLLAYEERGVGTDDRHRP